MERNPNGLQSTYSITLILFFADDCLLFLQDISNSANILLSVIGRYEEASGQKINIDKSSIFFAKILEHNRRSQVGHILGMKISIGNGKYLGLPYLIGRSKSDIFTYLKEKIWKKTHGWKEKLLSKGGKEILIKSVLQAIPTYAM